MLRRLQVFLIALALIPVLSQGWEIAHGKFYRAPRKDEMSGKEVRDLLKRRCLESNSDLAKKYLSEMDK